MFERAQEYSTMRRPADAFESCRCRTSPPCGEPPAHLVVISDDGADTMPSRDEKKASGRTFASGRCGRRGAVVRWC
jgi:hypothetical protein